MSEKMSSSSSLISSDDEGDKRCARNLPWQKIFQKRVSPVCLAVVEEREKCQLNDSLFFKHFLDSETKRTMKIANETVVVTVVRDARKPPPDLAYNQITLAMEDPDCDGNSSPRISSDGVYLVREITAFPLAPNKPCVNERLFMDRKRENYKSKGWGLGRWRVWLALEDVDAARKKRKKAEIASRPNRKKEEPATPPTDSKKILHNIDVDAGRSNKRLKEGNMGSFLPTMNALNLLRPVQMPVASSTLPRGIFEPSIMQAQQRVLAASVQAQHHQQQQQQQMMSLLNSVPILPGMPSMGFPNPASLPMPSSSVPSLMWMNQPSMVMPPRLQQASMAPQMMPWIQSGNLPFAMPGKQN